MAVHTFHETDLFHPHADPDDHWDLACQFALAKKGLIRLDGVLIDDPPCVGYGDPDMAAVSQLNELCALSVPVGVGQPSPDASAEWGSGLTLLMDTLENAPEPVVVHIVGSCRDVALAAKLNSRLFREKVAALYLNAGSGTITEQMEYNVELDIPSYAAMFDLPCKVYWMPCFHAVNQGVGEYGTFYSFEQREILPRLSAGLQNYFLYALGRSADTQWRKVLGAPVDTRLLEYYGARTRNMWCTGGFLHAVGLTVLTDGSICALNSQPEREAYEFVPVSVHCGSDGLTRWQSAGSESGQYIFRVRDQQRYPAAMTAAMRTLLSEVGGGRI